MFSLHWIIESKMKPHTYNEDDYEQCQLVKWLIDCRLPFINIIIHSHHHLDFDFVLFLQTFIILSIILNSSSSFGIFSLFLFFKIHHAIMNMCVSWSSSSSSSWSPWIGWSSLYSLFVWKIVSVLPWWWNGEKYDCYLHWLLFHWFVYYAM